MPSILAKHMDKSTVAPITQVMVIPGSKHGLPQAKIAGKSTSFSAVGKISLPTPRMIANTHPAATPINVAMLRKNPCVYLSTNKMVSSVKMPIKTIFILIIVSQSAGL